ncbi:MAG: hypothetical protein FWC76_02230 [Defluviitaleaceae bacterium]|nr:hypothetical protein [Defluviitaleaceae bacterium]
MENKLLASAKYCNPVIKWLCTFMALIGLAIPIVTVLIIFGDFNSFLNYDGNALDRILADEDGLIFLIASGAVIVLVPLFLLISQVSIHVYESHVTFKWARLRKALEVEYSQIESIEIGRLWSGSDSFARNGLIGMLVAILFFWVKTLDIKLHNSKGIPEEITYIIGGPMTKFNKKKAAKMRDLILERMNFMQTDHLPES